MSMKNHGGMIETGKTEEIEEEPVPVSLCTPTWNDPGANPGFHTGIRGRVVNTSASYPGGPSLEMSARSPVTEVFHSFTQSVQENTRFIPYS
jgi:hypothetical protein